MSHHGRALHRAIRRHRLRMWAKELALRLVEEVWFLTIKSGQLPRSSEIVRSLEERGTILDDYSSAKKWGHLTLLPERKVDHGQ